MMVLFFPSRLDSVHRFFRYQHRTAYPSNMNPSLSSSIDPVPCALKSHLHQWESLCAMHALRGCMPTDTDIGAPWAVEYDAPAADKQEYFRKIGAQPIVLGFHAKEGIWLPCCTM